MVSINTNLPRSSPFSSPFAGDAAQRAHSTAPEALSDANRSAGREASDYAARAEPQPATASSDPFSSTLDWIGGAMTGAKAALEHLAKEVGLQSQVAYLFGRNGQGALNREWAASLEGQARFVGAVSVGQNLAQDIYTHGVVEGTMRTGLEELGGNAGAVFGATLLRGPAGVVTAAVGAVVGEDLGEFAADRISEGFWAGDELYAQTIASGGVANDAVVANLESHQSWLTSPDLSPLERVEQFAVDGLQTFGGDIGVLWNSASDWLSGGERFDDVGAGEVSLAESF